MGLLRVQGVHGRVPGQGGSVESGASGALRRAGALDQGLQRPPREGIPEEEAGNRLSSGAAGAGAGAGLLCNFSGGDSIETSAVVVDGVLADGASPVVSRGGQLPRGKKAGERACLLGPEPRAAGHVLLRLQLEVGGRVGRTYRHGLMRVSGPRAAKPRRTYG